MKNCFLTISLVLCVFGAGAEVAHAEVATTFSLPQDPFIPPGGGHLVNGVDGYDFVPTSDLLVTSLGWYDHTGNGLKHDHPVGIYETSTEQLVAPSATITTGDPLDASNSFRFVAVTPFLLRSGVSYTLQGYGSGPDFDEYVGDPVGGIHFGPNIDFRRARSGSTSGLQFGDAASQQGSFQDVYFGPNFKYSTVPEPGAFLVLGMGILGMPLLRQRKSR